MKARLNSHTILLGGIGGDSHSVGLTILRQALSMNGYRVLYLGTQNKLECFFQHAVLSNVVMISCMDGHARYYLREFTALKNKYQAHSPLWYLGGNIDVGNGCGSEREFLEMGFARVFVRFVDVLTVLEVLGRDLNGKQAAPDCQALWERKSLTLPRPSTAVSDTRIELEQNSLARQESLSHWKTGPQAINLYDNAVFLSRQPSFQRIQALVNSRRLPIIIQPRSGVPLIEEQIRLFEAFKESGAQVLSYQVDSFTRNNNYAGAEEAINESRATGVATINGFPIINYGVTGLRNVIRRVGVPLQTRHSARDPRLLAEISYAGGVTSFEGGAVCYNIPYYRDYPLDESIRNWQYVDRLTGLYYDRFGIILDREFFGTLTATLIPPSIAIVVNIIEAVLAVRQGVKSVSLGYAEQGHRVQDLAAVTVLREMSAEILRNLGYKDIHINTVFHQYMAAFPEDYRRSVDLIYNSAITGALSGATRIITKTPVETLGIPSLDENLYGISLALKAVSDATNYPIDESRLADECAVVRREAEAIFDSIVFCGHGDIARGVVTGFQKGVIDIPFSPSLYNAGEVTTARDIEGAVRFLSIGNLQFDRELRQLHQEKMAERRRMEGLFSEKRNYLLIEKDVLRIARCQYDRWPLFG